MSDAADEALGSSTRGSRPYLVLLALVVGLLAGVLARGLGLSCLQWPWEQFTRERPTADYLPQADMKRTARGVPLRYKYPQYFWSKQDLPAQMAWCWHLRTGAREPQTLRSSTPIVLDRYGAVS